MRLNLNDSDYIHAPSETDLKRSVDELSVDQFVILSGQDGHFIQTYLNSDGTYQLEYRQGSSDQHFFVDSKSITVEDVAKAFVLFRQESSELNAAWHWQPLCLGSETPGVVDEGVIPAERRVEYHGITMSADWPQEIEEAQERSQYTMHGERWNRIPQRSLVRDGESPGLCSECGVLVAQFHVPGCGKEECPRCHDKLVECVCEIDEEY